MDADIFDQALSELASIGYDRLLCLQEYGEPLLHKDDILRRIRQARKMLPETTIYFSTNGDYLTGAVLKELADASLNRLTISIHPVGAYVETSIMDAYHALARRSGLQMQFIDHEPGYRITASAQFESIAITLRAVNFEQFGANRGGLLKTVRSPDDRIASCMRPFNDFVVSYTGEVYPCCNFVAGTAAHAKFVSGTLGPKQSIFDIYASKATAFWRKATFVNGKKPVPCNTCAMEQTLLPDEENTRREAFLKAIGTQDSRGAAEHG